jgi:hypothetical protein
LKSKRLYKKHHNGKEVYADFFVCNAIKQTEGDGLTSPLWTDQLAPEKRTEYSHLD